MAAPNEIQVGRYNRFVQKLLSIKGHATTYLASPEVDFVIPLFHGPENRYLEGWDRYGYNTSIAAAAGFQSTVRIRNPSGSNMVAVLEKATLVNSALVNMAAIAQQAVVSTDLTAPTPGFRLDARGRPNSTAIISTSNTVAASIGNSFDEVGLSSTQGTGDFVLDDNQELPLFPGDAIQFITSAVNVAIAFSFRWRERFLEDSERA